MQRTLEQLEREAQKLPRKERAKLAEALLASLDRSESLHQAWVAEAGRRAEQIDAGKTTTMTVEEVLADLDSVVDG